MVPGGAALTALAPAHLTPQFVLDRSSVLALKGVISPEFCLIKIVLFLVYKSFKPFSTWQFCRGVSRGLAGGGFLLGRLGGQGGGQGAGGGQGGGAVGRGGGAWGRWGGLAPAEVHYGESQEPGHPHRRGHVHQQGPREGASRPPHHPWHSQPPPTPIPPSQVSWQRMSLGGGTLESNATAP